MKNPWLSKTDAGKRTQMSNFGIKFPNYGATLGYTPLQITAAVADCTFMVYMLDLAIW